MKIWKYNQQLYHLMTDRHEDDIQYKELNVKPLAVEDVIDYFENESNLLTFPAKSYAVAIIYAKLLEYYFQEDFYDVLDDPDLLYGNDKYFVRYSKNVMIYDEIISKIDLTFSKPIDQVLTTITYFKKEFL